MVNIEKNFKPFMELVNEKNMFADADSLNLPAVKAGDKVLTLSTCTEDSADLERFVVHALLVSVDGRDVSDADSQVEQ